MNTGEINKLKVLRKTDIGYMLVDENNNEVFMHFNENDMDINVDDLIDVFLFYDKKNRLTATTRVPYITLSTKGFLNVISINPDLGIFLDNNSSKDVLLSKDHLPKDQKDWPIIDDKIIVKLINKNNRLSARLCTKQDIIECFRNNEKYVVGSKVFGYICKLTEAGVGIISYDYQYIFVHRTMMRQRYRLGEGVEVRIIQVRDNEYSGTLLLNKEKMIDPDCELIINYLKRHNNFMVFNAKTPSAEIEAAFKISKKAFKRALGSLYKDKIVQTDDNGTRLMTNN